jgi:hypothetical protein
MENTFNLKSESELITPVKRRKSPSPVLGRKKKIKNHPGQVQMDFDSILESMNRSEESMAMIRLMLHLNGDRRHQWRGMFAVPPSGLATAVISEFRQKTNIPLEIPFFTLLSVISGIMLNRRCVLETETMGVIRPDIWTVILASSGAGKTYTQKQITNSINLEGIEFSGNFVSAAAFVQALKDNPAGLWIRDEYAQFLKSIESSDGPMGEMKDYMLRLYDNSKIERTTKEDSISIKNPAMTILGLTVLETFGKYVSAESMLDGFAQRFSYVKAETDPDRNFKDYPLWQVDSKIFDNHWKKVLDCIKPKYFVDESIIYPAFSESFNSLFDERVPESFFRRMIWKSTKYAMLYHVLRGDNSDRLVAEDFGWAARLLSIHVQDAVWLIGEHNIGELEKVIASTERAIKRLTLKNGRPPTMREIVQNVSAIKTVSQAHQITRLLGSYLS